MNTPPDCRNCKHYDIFARVPACKAFPDGIPMPIWKNEVSHRKPYKGDHGIQFEPVEKAGKGDK